MRIGRPRIGTIDSCNLARMGLTGASPQTESTINMNPRTGSFTDGNKLLERINCADIKIGGIQHNYGWAFTCG